MPRNVPSFDHSGLALRTRQRSRPIVAVAPGLVVARELVVGAALRQRLGDVLGRQHAGQDRVVAALDARHVDEARRAADQRAARERQLRHRLVAALGDGARAIGEPLAALEGAADQRMGLEALEFVERRQIRIRVVEMHDEADRHQVVVEVIEERAAAGRLSSGQPNECCTRPGWCLSGATCQSSFRPMPNFCGSRPSVEAELRDQLSSTGCRARLRRTACTWRAAPCRG